MDRSEAQAILTAHLDRYRRRSYGDLVALMDDVHVSEVVGPSGVEYQIELEVVWDSPREKASVRVLGAIDDGRLPGSIVPVSDSFIVTLMEPCAERAGWPSNKEFWPAPVGLAWNHGFSPRELSEIRRVIVEHEAAMIIEIRNEQAGDIPAIRDVNRRAFEQDQEANIVDALRFNGASSLSLVATLNNRVVGHVMYSPAEVGQLVGAGLGPMAVLPEHQRQGVGTQLIEAGNGQLKATGCPFIVVIGHADYYPRFGFQPARPLGMTCEWDVPDDVFLLLVLDPGKMHGVSGPVKYRHEFSTVS